MDITNEQEKLNDPNPRPSQHHAMYSSSDRVIPEMVITAAENASEHETNISESTTVLIPSTSSHSTDTNVRDTSTEFARTNSVLEEKSDLEFEDVSTVVKDIITKCTESVSHSIHQRPLRMEIDKNAQQQENVKSTPVKCSPPPPPPPLPSPLPPTTSSISSTPPFSVTPPPVSSTVTTSPTAMQRPLVFEGVITTTESVPETQKCTSLEQTVEKKEELVSTNQEAQITPEISVEKSSEEYTSATKKEGLHGVKKFFDSILHHDTQQPVYSEELESPKELVSPDTPKSGKSSIKKFFQSPKSDSTKIEHPSSVEFQNETKDATPVSKQNKKFFFDAFKHETPESKNTSKKIVDTSLSKENIDIEKTSPSSETESPKTPSSFAKDTKQNIKAFFDTFRHEPSEQKQPDKSVPSINIISENEKDSYPITAESLKESKESTSFAKDTKQNIKTFFSSFKLEPEGLKSKDTTTEKSRSQPNIRIESDQSIQSSIPESPKESSFVKDTKQNIKSFFDTFKHEPSEIKQKNAICKKSSSHPDFSQEYKETVDIVESSEKVKHKESFAKSAKQNVKTFFDSFKHEQGTSKQEETQKKIDGSQKIAKELEETDKSSEKHKEPTSPKTDTKQPIKTFFDNFRLGDLHTDQSKEKVMKTISEPDLHNEFTNEGVTTHKDSKHGMKTFLDNFKLGDLNADSKSKEICSKSEFNKETGSETLSSHKENKHSVKKLFSFKQDKDIGESEASSSLDTHILKKSEKGKSGKIVKSVKLDLHPKYSNGSENVSASFSQMNGHETEIISEIKERAQSVPVDPAKSKSIFTSLEKKPEVCASSLDSPDSQSVEFKGSRQSMKKFFDSFKSDKTEMEKCSSSPVSNKKESMKGKNTTETLAEDEESKIVEKSSKEKKNKSIRRSLSDKLNREEVVQNFKGFFDSLAHKSSSKKSDKDTEHIYDVVEVKPESEIPITTVNISSEVYPSKCSLVKGETQGTKKNLSPFHSKDTPKSGSENIYISENKLEKEKEKCLPKVVTPQKPPDSLRDIASPSTIIEDSSPTMSEPSSPKSEKNVFNAIGENILALKEKMLHPKEKRKSEFFDDSVEISDKTSKINEISKDKSQEAFMAPVSNEQNIVSAHSIISAQGEELPKCQTSLPVIRDVTKKEVSSTHPNSLYDTCCVKLAFLLRDKALEVVSERTKSPPPKPPKPSAEAIAKARASAIAKKIEAQKMNKSFGDNFPISYDGMRFADDETESSCDYKDVENFDYIMDYELINRYKIDSSKLDTFSVPSTCSGVTSYYTADSIMETISLSSDISYNFKQILPNKNEMKVSSAEENKKGKIDSGSSLKSELRSKQKKVPPPIPPKPLILQNISKIKEKSDDKAVSQCVNGLSLSPRLQSKFPKDPAVTQKRPLLVADIKGTQFSSLPHPKKPQKPSRNFDTVLRNESLKKVPCVSSDNVPAATETDSSLQHGVKIEKRTISPPRPPLPNIMKKPEKPPKPDRPPPPIKTLKSSAEEVTENSVKKEEENKDIEIDEFKENEKPSDMDASDIIKLDLKEAALSDKDKFGEMSVCEDRDNYETSRIPEVNCDSNNSDFKTLQDNLNNNYETGKDTTDNLSSSNIEMNNSVLFDKPKPPPRNRRIRSKTVEIFPKEKQEEGLKRSSSLSEIDVEKRVTFLEAEKAKIDSKSLYTTVNKNGKKTNYEKTSQSSPDLVSGRPLPPPPPPPRRFRSLERKCKSKKAIDEEVNEKTVSVSGEVTVSDYPKAIKPPVRRRKTDKQRFLSLHTDRRKEISIASENLQRAQSAPAKPERRLKTSSLTKYDVNANISSLCTQQDQNSSNQSIPSSDITDSASRSNPKLRESESKKRSHSSWYDEDESLGDSWETVDAFIPSHESAEEYKESPKVPLRRKPGTRRKSREASKFYINMEEDASSSAFEERAPSLTPIDKGDSPLRSVNKAGSPLPLVDKETSPLPLDCSEKSVQTSLETLSHGIVSHDEDQSEDTDELLDLAQTLQKELSCIINRHKSVADNIEDTPSPPLSAATSEKNLADDFKYSKKISSVRSSTSEVWPITSSDESDVERVGEDSSNINEVSIKRKQKKIFYIAQEIMTSEEAFVDALKLLNVDFKAAVEAANKQKNMTIIPDEALSQILNHLPQLQHLNENLLMELKDRIKNWDKHEKIADIIVKMGPFLKLYSWYIHDFESNVSLFDDCKKKYPAFAQVVKEFEMGARCKKLALNHFMLKPIQRIPQYRLLLQEYLHQLTENSKDYQDTVAALQIVSDVANHANDSMKQGDNAQKLISIQNSIVGHKEIVKPGRVFIKEGELMKLSRKGMQPRWFVLLNDLLLYLTPVQQGLYRVNHELPLTGMKVAIPIQQDYQNEFSIISVTRSFTLAARSQEERQEWIIALTKAIEENASKRSTFTNSRLHQKAQDKTSSEDEGAFVLGKKAPVWIPDARVTMCQLCTSEFTVTFRRHHCRACGKVICSICSSHRISLPYLGNRIARVCDECHARLGQGSSACTESGETDSDNQQIAVKPHLRTDNRHIKKNKRSLPSVLKEVCANDQGSTISGYLHKKSGKSWKRDWFVVKDKVLYEYKASEDIAALRSTPLLGYEIESFSETYEGIDASLLFQLTHPGQAPIIFYADTVGSAERWVSALKTATVLE